MAAAHRNRVRAEGFGQDAAAYDQYRPGYPPELIAWLSASGPGRAADIGCGTGQVARLLRDAGWDVVGVEIDERMAAVARSHGVDVEVTAFEQWAPARGDFDLLCSGQAWHWIDPAVGCGRAGALLRAGGRLAVFWNTYRYDDEVRAVFDEVLGRVHPDLLVDSVLLGTADPAHADRDVAAMRRYGADFGGPDHLVFEHSREQTATEWLAEVHTHSQFASLPDALREQVAGALTDGLATVVGDGVLRVTYETRVSAWTKQS